MNLALSATQRNLTSENVIYCASDVLSNTVSKLLRYRAHAYAVPQSDRRNEFATSSSSSCTSRSCIVPFFSDQCPISSSPLPRPGFPVSFEG
jgi:hypothetical protein